MTTAVLALINARRAGARVFVRNGKLVVSADEPLADDVLADLREHRDRLIQLLTIDGDLGDRPHWKTYDGHDCWSGCEREHQVCNACAQPLAARDRLWPHLHWNCRLERLD